MLCECVSSTSGVGFNSSDCQIHCAGGLRDQEQNRRDEWKSQHPVRWFLMRLECKIRYPKMFKMSYVWRGK